jgi:hypothetical protein
MLRVLSAFFLMHSKSVEQSRKKVFIGGDGDGIVKFIFGGITHDLADR